MLNGFRNGIEFLQIAKRRTKAPFLKGRFIKLFTLFLLNH